VIIFEAPTKAESHLPRFISLTARSIAVSEDEQPVSTTSVGPEIKLKIISPVDSRPRE